MSKMKVFGADLMKKNNKWVVIEINAEPAFDFFENEREKLICDVLTLMKKSATKN